jgi:hypothetical protein
VPVVGTEDVVISSIVRALCEDRGQPGSRPTVSATPMGGQSMATKDKNTKRAWRRAGADDAAGETAGQEGQKVARGFGRVWLTRPVCRAIARSLTQP